MQDSKMWLLVAFSSNSGLSLGLRAVLARPEAWPVSLFCLQCAFGISEYTTRVSFDRTIRLEFGVGMVGEKPNLLFPWSKPFYRPLIWCNGTCFPIPSPYLNRNMLVSDFITRLFIPEQFRSGPLPCGMLVLVAVTLLCVPRGSHCRPVPQLAPVFVGLVLFWTRLTAGWHAASQGQDFQRLQSYCPLVVSLPTCEVCKDASCCFTHFLWVANKWLALCGPPSLRRVWMGTFPIWYFWTFPLYAIKIGWAMYWFILISFFIPYFRKCNYPRELWGFSIFCEVFGAVKELVFEKNIFLS